jgi:hypothetical protein
MFFELNECHHNANEVASLEKQTGTRYICRYPSAAGVRKKNRVLLHALDRVSPSTHHRALIPVHAFVAASCVHCEPPGDPEPEPVRVNITESRHVRDSAAYTSY